MGTCTSTARHRQKQPHHNRVASKSSVVFDIKQPPPLPPFPISALPHYQTSYSYTEHCDLQASTIRPIFHPTDTNSLIQLYSTHTNSSYINGMSSSSSASAPAHPPPRIPIPKTRLPAYRPPPPAPSTVSIRPKQVTLTTVMTNDQTGLTRPMSITNRPPSSTSMQNRFGFIPRPTAPGSQPSNLTSRSRSISPTSTVSAHSSSSSSIASQRVNQTQSASKATTNRSVPSPSSANHPNNGKTPLSSRPRDSSVSKTNVKSNLQTPTTASRMRSQTPSRVSATSLSSSSPSSVASPTPLSISPVTQTTSTVKTDLNAVRDRYKSQKRMNFFTRRTPIPTANGSPMMVPFNNSPEPNRSPKDKRPSPAKATSPNTDVKTTTATTTTPKVTSAPAVASSTSGTSPSSSSTSHPPSAHLSQSNRHRQRAINMLSSASTLSDVLNQDALLEDDNCSLKSDDLMCDYEETLTIDSSSKNEQTDSCSSTSLSIDLTGKSPATITNTPTKPIMAREHRSATIAKCTSNTTNGSLRESLDELNRLSNRMDQSFDSEDKRKLLTRSVSLKPPHTYLPPLEDAEQITMDIESYRQVMKDVTVVKTILHQLDRLLKHSDGANMTDSMIGSFHEFHDSMITSRRFSISGDGNVRSSIDENSSYDDLVKEIMTLRKEKEQDKQTIKLLQEQMYKYSSQTNV